jgi:hypothetical protein
MGMSRRFLLLALALAAPAAPAAPATAQTPAPTPATAPSEAWSRTGPLGSPSFGTSRPELAFDAAGRGLVGWSAYEQLTSASTPPRGRLAALPAGSAAGSATELPGDLATAPLPLGGGRTLLVVEQAVRGDGEAIGPVRLRAAVRAASGRLSRWRVVARYGTAGAVTAAVSRTGEVSLAWVEAVAPGTGFEARYRLRMAVRRDGRFSTPVTAAGLGPVEHPGYVTASAAYDRSGRLLLVAPALRQRGRRTVGTVVALTGRRGALRRQLLGPQSGVTDVRAATSRSGRAVVAWATQDGGEEANQPYVVRAAIRERGERRFGRARVVDPGAGRRRPAGTFELALGRDGGALMTWSQVAGDGSEGPNPVVVASAAPGARFGRPAVLDPDGAAGDVAIAPDGRAIAVWSRILRGNLQQPDQVFAALRPAGSAAFAAAEAVSADGVAGRPSAAFDPATGRPAVAWSERPGEVRPPEAGGGSDTIIRAAVRAAP